MTAWQRFMKIIYPILRAFHRLIGKNNHSYSSSAPAIQSFYGLSATQNNGQEINFSSFRNKKVLIVNTASDCGYASQFKDMEALFEMKKDSIEILAFPANDFKQETYDDPAIDEFCKKHYGVTFPVMKKSKVVIHSAQNKVYEWLTDKDRNGWNEHAPTWNFCKYLVDEKGNLTHFFEAAESPTGKKILSAIEEKN